MALGPIGIAGAALAGGSALGGLFAGRSQASPVDISGELRRIGELYEQARVNARAAIGQQFNQRRQASAQNLAGRGVYRSPVSENTFQALEGARLGALAQSDAELFGRQAGTESSLLSNLMGLRMQQDQRAADAENQRMSSLFGLGGNIGTSLLLSSLLGPAGGAAAGMAGRGGGGINPLLLSMLAGGGAGGMQATGRGIPR